MVQAQFYTPQTYLAFNLTGARNVFPGIHKNSGTVVTASYTNKFSTYFSKFSCSRLSLLGNFKNGYLVLVSAKSLAQDIQDLNFLVQLPLIQFEKAGVRMSLPPAEIRPQDARDTVSTARLLASITTIWTTKIGILYKLLTVLSLHKTL